MHLRGEKIQPVVQTLQGFSQSDAYGELPDKRRRRLFMCHPIEKLPRDGTAKPTEAVEWVSENGEPEITPTRWHPLARHQYRPREGERSLLAASSFIVILGTATLIATNFSAEVAAYVTRSTGHEVLHIAIL